MCQSALCTEVLSITGWWSLTCGDIGAARTDANESHDSQGRKRKFLQSIASSRRVEGSQQVGGDARKDAQESMVSFSLQSLLDFQHSLREHAALGESKEADRRCRQRPNYNNSKRSFFAKGRTPIHHE